MRFGLPADRIQAGPRPGLSYAAPEGDPPLQFSPNHCLFSSRFAVGGNHMVSCFAAKIVCRNSKKPTGLHGRFRMKNQYVLEVLTQVNPLIGSQYPHRKADKGPHVNHGIIAAVMLAELMNLGMAIMAAGDTVIRTGRLYLVVLELAEFQTLFFHAGLEETAAPAATIIIGPVGFHINKVFFSNHRFDHISQIFGNRITKGLAYDLTGILDGKFYFQILVPVGIYLEPALTDPFGVVLIDVLDDKVVLDVEFFQSCQD